MQISPIPSHKYCLEKGPGGQLGVWTRDGENYAFFTPLSELEKREQSIKQIRHIQDSQVESKDDYYKRKINSHEWMG